MLFLPYNYHIGLLNSFWKVRYTIKSEWSFLNLKKTFHHSGDYYIIIYYFHFSLHNFIKKDQIIIKTTKASYNSEVSHNYFTILWFYFYAANFILSPVRWYKGDRKYPLCCLCLVSFEHNWKFRIFHSSLIMAKRIQFTKSESSALLDKIGKTDAKSQHASPLQGWWSNWLWRIHILGHSSADNDLLDGFLNLRIYSEQCHSKAELKCGLLLVILQE